MAREIEPYEQTLNNMGAQAIKSWAEGVMEQLREAASPEEDSFVFLAGDRYRKYLLPHIKHGEIPLQGLRIGEQLQKLKAWTA